MAETDYKAKAQQFRAILFGLLDCAIIALLFLPFFGQPVNGSFEQVPLLGLTSSEAYILIPYFAGIGATALLGVLALALQNSENRTWVSFGTKASLSLSSLMVLLFIASREPYAAALTFIFLAIKASVLMKRA